MTLHQATGRTAGRFIRTIGIAQGNMDAAVAYVEAQNWDNKAAIIGHIKSPVSGIELSDVPATAVGSDFLEAVRPRSILGRLERVRQVPSRVNMIAFGAGAVAFPVDEKQFIPVSRAELNGIQVTLRKVGGISVVTNEALQNATNGTDTALCNDLAEAVGEAEDKTFFDPAFSGSLLNGAPTAVSAGTTLANVDTDLQKAVDLLLATGGKLRDGVWVMTPEAAVKLAGMRGTGGAPAFPGIGIDGGELLKMPVITSESADGLLGLVDQSGLLVSGDSRAEISLARNTTIAMNDGPESDPSELIYVSMFQTECTAIKGVLCRGWKARPGSASYISGGLW